MTVQELIEQLLDFPKDMSVKISGYTFDGGFEQDVDYTDTVNGDIDFVAIYGKEE